MIAFFDSFPNEDSDKCHYTSLGTQLRAETPVSARGEE